MRPRVVRLPCSHTRECKTQAPAWASWAEVPPESLPAGDPLGSEQQETWALSSTAGAVGWNHSFPRLLEA